ncbi:MAG: MopE-related protein [Myxococcota bacterium]
MRRFCTLLFVVALATSGCGSCDDSKTGTNNGSDTGQADTGADGEAQCVDADNDGFFDAEGCGTAVDCNDADASINPDAMETCGDGIDNDCSGTVDDGCEACTDGDTQECGTDVGACEIGTQTCVDGEWSACEGGVQREAEVCDGVDNDCDGETDENGESLCDDGILCNGQETCNAGSCEAGEPVDCSQFDGACTIGKCAEKDGSCVQVLEENGVSCDDGNFCTIDGVCQDGVCETSPRDCSGEGDQCNTGVCDEDADACVPQPLSDGTTCDDGSFCTVADACSDGVCGGTARDCSGESDQCNEGVCDENADACVPQPIADGTSCDDGQYCTTNDTCQQGTCTAGPARQCGAAGGSCRTGTCDEANDTCTGDPVPDGTSCDDGSFCTIDDSCQAGTCSPGLPRDCSSAGDQCNEGTCDENLNRCTAQPVADGTSCDDNRFCTISDVCTSGSCGGSNRDCSSETDQCNTGVCNETADQCEGRPVSDGTTCDDSLFCTVSDTCTSGTCGGSTRPCGSAGDQCNDGICDESSDACIASPKPDGTTCDDTEYCTTNDTCSGGTCNGSSRDCSAFDDQCNTGVCDDSIDSCKPVPVTDGTSCDDGLFCTQNDACTSGTCDGTQLDCSSLNTQCERGVCDESAQSCITEDRPDGSSCSDGLYCTVNDSCQSGSCTGSSRDCSSFGSGDPCADGICNESANTCETQIDTTCCDTTVDNDLDGSNQCEDCDESDGSVYPGAAERCNGVDDDCDGLIDEDFDQDGDGYSVCSQDPTVLDCDDSNPNVNPGATEDCGPDGTGNGIDDNCNGYIDEGCDPCTTDDVDGDGYSECDGDCDDNDASRYPTAPEQCDGVDNDCNVYTRANCGVSEPCNFDGDSDPSNESDVCQDDMICGCEVNASGSCNGNYLCTPFCNASFTGGVGDGCGSDQTCLYDLLRSSNIHGCAVREEVPGTKLGGETCSADSECRSLNCDKLCRGPGCNTEYCLDWCSSDAYCGSNATCRLRRTTDPDTGIDGRCWPDGGPFLGANAVGDTCSSDSDCDHGFCMTDPNTGSKYCTEACCQESDCPGGFSCGMLGDKVDTSYVYGPETASSCTTDSDCTGEGGICNNGSCVWRLTTSSPMCIKEVGGQGTRLAGNACSSNDQCASGFCEKDLGVCISTCCSDSTCPSGLSCEKQYVQNDTERITQVRVCVNLSTDDVLEYK